MPESLEPSSELPSTDRERELRRALAVSEARQRQLTDTAYEGIWQIDANAKTVFVNRRMADMLGYTQAELMQRTVFDLSSPQDHDQGSKVLARRLGGISEQHDWRFIRKDGSELWCIISGTPTYDEHGAITGALGLITDITERKQSERRLQRLSRLYAVSSGINEAIVRIREPQELYQLACKIAVDQGGVSLAWIGLRIDPAKPLQLVGQCGGSDDYIKRVLERVRSEPREPGPGTRAMRDGNVHVSNDIANDSSFYWKDPAMELGLRSAAFFPLKSENRVIGLLALYAADIGFFEQEEVRVLTALADNISFAVESATKDSALREHERMLATLFTNLPGMTYRCRNDAHWTMEVVSPGCRDLTGYSQESLLNNRDISYDEVTYPLDRDAMRSQIEAALAAKVPYEISYRIVTKQGDVKWVWERGTGVFGEQGELRFLEGFITDITARREAEQKVAEQAALLDKATDAIVLYGLDDAVYYWNRGAERLYGWSVSEAIGRKITQLTCRDTAARRALIARLLAHGEWTGELTQFSKSGAEVTVDASWTLVRDEEGKPRSILAINTDITQRKKLEAQFLTTQRLESIGTLAGGIAHDFNNILAAITGNTKLALADLAQDHPLRSNLREIERASLRAGELVRQILTFSRRQESQRRSIDLQEVVEEALRLLRATVPAQVEFVTYFDPHTPRVSADTTQIHQVVVNLGANAAYAMREHGGVLSVRIEAVDLSDSVCTSADVPADLAPGRYARLQVSDTGNGMDAATLGRIFEPFFTTKAAGQGTGLGLSVVHGIMRAHDGTIAVDSAIGRGTAFHLYFPQSLETDLPADRLDVRATHLGEGQRVLYVDDEEPLVFLATRVLERLGYRVTGRTDALQALVEFTSDPHAFDALVSDLSMPGMTGPELARAVLNIRPEMPIVLTSGYLREQDMKLVRELGIRDLVLKPNTVEDLGEALHRALTGSDG